MHSSSSFCDCKGTRSLIEQGPQTCYFNHSLERLVTDPSKNKKRTIKNLFLMCTSYWLAYQSLCTLGQLQSTVNDKDGIGVESLAVQFVMALVCVMLFSEILVKMFGCKKMMILMFVLQLPWEASNLNPCWGTLIPSSALAGATLGLMLMGVSHYINEMCVLYHSQQESRTLETITSHFFGIFSFFISNSYIWGNLIAYFTLLPDVAPPLNHTNVACGVDFFENSSTTNNDNLDPPSESKMYTLVGICMSGTVLSIVLLMFADELDSNVPGGRIKFKSLLKSQWEVVRQTCVPEQVLLLPLSVFFGIQSGFYTADFSKAYIACSWGVYHIGFVTIIYGVCGAVMGCCVGKLVNLTSQTFSMIFGALLNAVLIVFLFYWDPSPDFIQTYFVVAGIWGVGDAIWWSQISAAYGLIFPRKSEAAYSVLYFCIFLGYALNFSTSTYFSIRGKLFINTVFLIVGMAGYLIGQIKRRIAFLRVHQ